MSLCTFKRLSWSTLRRSLFLLTSVSIISASLLTLLSRSSMIRLSFLVPLVISSSLALVSLISFRESMDPSFKFSSITTSAYAHLPASSFLRRSSVSRMVFKLSCSDWSTWSSPMTFLSLSWSFYSSRILSSFSCSGSLTLFWVYEMMLSCASICFFLIPEFAKWSSRAALKVTI